MAGADLILAIATIISGAVIGYVATWLRVDLDLRPKEAAVGSGAIAAGFALLWLIGPDGGVILILFAAFGPLIWIDIRRNLLPDPITLPLIAIGILTAFASGRGLDGMIGATLGYFTFRGLALIWLKTRGVDALGHGDAKLIAAIGAFLGWMALPEIVLIAAVSGVIAALLKRARTGSDEIAFGPPLAVGAALSWAFGPIFG